MPTLPAHLDIPDITTDAQIARYERIEPLLTALFAIVTRAAQRRPADIIPGTIFDDARTLLADIRRLTAREPGHSELLVLHEPPSWVALASRLAFAGNALEAFHDRYNPYDENVFERSTVRDLEFRSSSHPYGEGQQDRGGAAGQHQ